MKKKTKNRWEKHQRTKDDFDSIYLSGASDITEAFPQQMLLDCIETIQKNEKKKDKKLRGMPGKTKAQFWKLYFASKKIFLAWSCH